ncbi:MAG: peptidase domain-containing ABC transporter [Chitinophagales bacterium]|nr:peptidase domain-containing ABC transporter [Chitinophagales bacterium]
MRKFPHYQQAEVKDCGPTCIKIIAKYYGELINTQQLRQLSETTRQGSNLLKLSEAVEKIGFRSLALKVSTEHLRKAPLPCIVHWDQNHYVVVYKIKRNKFFISDPAHGLLTYSKEQFIEHWIGRHADAHSVEGIALLLEPTPDFYQEEFDTNPPLGFRLLSAYIFRYKRFLFQLIIGLLTGSILQLLIPFLTQSIVDVGIKNLDLSFILLILFAQFSLFIGSTTLEIIRGWILLHLSTRINISIISDFFIKLMKLPISFFDARMTGDLLQRINDHKRIERILTTSSLSTLFSMINFVVFSLVLGYYSLLILGIFLLGSILYFSWVLFFFKKRKELDYKRFSEVSAEQSKVIELINGMQEIKLHNAERPMRWKWEYLQVRLFKIATQNLSLEQAQRVGSNFINEFKNLLITVLAAKGVIDGTMTLGMMLATTYIIGQLNAPITQLIQFLRDLQDAKISLSRLSEIHERKDEEEPIDQQRLLELPSRINMDLRDVTFRYTGTSDPVIKGLTLTIPANKITAIVGVSGSGKTTLMKLLLRFYTPETGEIVVNNSNISTISHRQWRDHCGTVMQEGYIFNDTIAQNIAVGVDRVDKEKLIQATNVANITDFVRSLPKGYNTKIGNEGIGLSTGQKQRLLIARAVYKNPRVLFFDEATSALDANNERSIMNKLNTFFKEKTVVVIAHRLSTVRNAHQIVVLDEGRIVEKGDHHGLVLRRGRYYQLVKNQLELGS